MTTLDLDTAVKQIRQACQLAKGRGQPPPFFFIVGAGISHPPVPLAGHINEHCKSEAQQFGLWEEPSPNLRPIDLYSHCFGRAYPQPVDRQSYLRDLMEKAYISRANFRLAHLLLEDSMARIVVTTNFDDFLSRALNLFGKPHIVCDHPQTTERIDVESHDMKIIHVHGTYRFYDCANLKDEIVSASQSSGQQAFTMASLLDGILKNRAPLVIGYSGWEGDVIMGALERRLAKPMPRNIYWFCYRRAEAEGIPGWLKRNSSLCLVLPREPASSNLGAAEKGLGTDLIKEPVLAAVSVLGALIQAFGLEPPPLTKDPIGFFAEQLRQALWTEEGQEETEDVYAIRALVQRVEGAKVCEQRLRAKVDLELEALREAVRRSDYKSAVREAQRLNLESLDAAQLREIGSSMSAAGESILDEPPEQLAACALTVKASDLLLTRGEKVPAERVARALLNKGFALGRLNRSEEGIEAYDELLRRFSDSSEPALRENVGKVLFNKGATLATLDRSEEAIAAYDELQRRFSDSLEPVLRERVAMALFNKGATLGRLNRSEEAIAAYDELLRRFSDSSEPALREAVARALVNKSATLGPLNRNEEAIAACDELLRRFSDSSEPALRENVAKALLNKAASLGELNRSEAAIAAYDELLRRFSDSLEPVPREQVATALFNKGVRLATLNRNEEAIAACDELLRRFSDSSEPALRENVAMALFNKGVTLATLNRSEAAIETYDEVLRRFSDSLEPVIRQQVAKALFGKGWTLATLNRSEEAIAAYDELLRRFSDSSEPALRENVGKALFNKGVTLATLNRSQEAIAAYEELMRRFPDSPEPVVRDLVDKARAKKEEMRAASEATKPGTSG